jgi:hypothetical protein
MNIIKRCIVAAIIAALPTCAIILAWLCLLCSFNLMETLRSVPAQAGTALTTMLGIVTAIVLPIDDVNEMIS